jgi:hypothetical protein
MFLLQYFPLFSIDYCIFYRLDIDYTDIECVATNDIGTMLRPCMKQPMASYQCIKMLLSNLV